MVAGVQLRPSGRSDRLGAHFTTVGLADGALGAAGALSAVGAVGVLGATGTGGAGGSGRVASREAWVKAVYEAHSAPLYRFLVRLTLGDRGAAEDLLQEVVLRAWKHADHLAGGVETLRPWLFKVARRLVIDAARAKSARPQEVGTEDVPQSAVHEDAAERVVTADVVRRALATLPPKHREVVIDLYYRELTVAHVAQRLGVPEGTVKSRAFYALKALRGALVDIQAVSPGAGGSLAHPKADGRS